MVLDRNGQVLLNWSIVVYRLSLCDGSRVRVFRLLCLCRPVGASAPTKLHVKVELVYPHRARASSVLAGVAAAGAAAARPGMCLRRRRVAALLPVCAVGMASSTSRDIDGLYNTGQRTPSCRVTSSAFPLSSAASFTLPFRKL